MLRSNVLGQRRVDDARQVAGRDPGVDELEDVAVLADHERLRHTLDVIGIRDARAQVWAVWVRDAKFVDSLIASPLILS